MLLLFTNKDSIKSQRVCIKSTERLIEEDEETGDLCRDRDGT